MRWDRHCTTDGCRSLRQRSDRNDNSLAPRSTQKLQRRYGELFFEALLFEEAGVVAVAGDEFVVGAEFGDAAGDEDGDLVGVAGGGDAVRDEDGGAAFHDSLQTAEDALFGVGVYAGEGVVEDEDLWGRG